MSSKSVCDIDATFIRELALFIMLYTLVGSEKVPFLGEGDLPMHLRDVNNEQPEEASSGGRSSNSTSANQPPLMAPQAPVSEESVKSLVEMGFSREQAIEALRVCNGNPDMASDYLLNMK